MHRQGQNLLRTENLIVGLAAEFGLRLTQYLWPTERVARLISQDRVAKSTPHSISPESADTAGQESFQLEQSEEVRNILSSAEKHAGERGSPFVKLDDVLASIWETPYSTILFKEYGLDRKISRVPDSESEGADATLTMLLRLFEEWRLAGQMVQLATIPANSSPDISLGARISMSGRVTSIDAAGFVTIAGPESQCFIDLRAASIGETYKEAATKSSFVVDVVLASGDRCIIIPRPNG